MAKTPTFDNITAGFGSASKLNSNFDAIETAFNNTISIDGSTPNTMAADFDLGGNDILNAGTINGLDISINGLSITDQVTAAETAAIDAAVSAAIVATLTEFTELTDVPAAYATHGGEFVKVNAGATALEFVAGGGSEPSDSDKGDITVTGSGLTWTIDALAVTDAKINSVVATKVTITDTGTYFVGTETEAALQEIGAFLALKAPLASPTFTGVPAADTAAPGTNTTQVATTAFVTAAVVAVTTPAWQEDFTSALTSINSVIPIDSTEPLVSEGVEIASIASVVVASGEQVEIQVDVSGRTVDNYLVVSLFRDSTSIATRATNTFASPDIANCSYFSFLDSPSAATYTYSLRVGVNTSDSGAYLNARDTGSNLNWPSLKSGMRLKVV